MLLYPFEKVQFYTRPYYDVRSKARETEQTRYESIELELQWRA